MIFSWTILYVFWRDRTSRQMRGIVEWYECWRDCGKDHGVSESILGYCCSRCGRRYAVHYSLVRHRKYECGVEKQFACRTCCRRFTRLDSMRVHQKRTGHHMVPYCRRRFPISNQQFSVVIFRDSQGETKWRRIVPRYISLLLFFTYLVMHVLSETREINYVAMQNMFYIARSLNHADPRLF